MRVTVATLFAMLLLACASSSAFADWGYVNGKVTDSSGAGIFNVEVDVYPTSGPNAWAPTIACTGFDGSYSVGELTGTYVVGFAPQGGPYGTQCFGSRSPYDNQYYNDKSSLAAADPVSVTQGATTSGIDAVLAATEITGTVTDSSTHAGIQGVQVDLLAAPGPNGRIIESTCSGSGGSYSFWQLDPGTYYVYFYPSTPDNDCGSGVNYLPQYYSGQASGGDPVSVAQGAVTSNIDAALDPGGQVTGRVADATGAGIANVEVDVFNSTDHRSSYACTAADGTYTVVGLPTDNYQVQFTAQKGLDLCPPYGYDNFGSQSYNGSVSVTAGSTLSGIDAVFHSGPELTGTVTDAATQGRLAGVEVDLYDSGGTIVKSVCSASDGTYSFSDLATGSYRVGFQPTAGQDSCGQGLFYFPQFYSGRASLASADPISVTSGGATVSNVNGPLHSQREVTGTVRDGSSHAALAGVEVDLYDSTGSIAAWTCSASDGTYSFADLPAGNYRAGFDPTAGSDSCGPGLEYFGQFYNGKSSLGSADQIPVASGSTASGIDAALVAGGKITGTVIDASSRAALGKVEVDVYDSGGGAVAHVCTASNGTYTVSMLAAGTYRVGFVGSITGARCATAADYVPQYFDRQTSLASADPVSVSSGATATSVNAKLISAPPSGTVRIDGGAKSTNNAGLRLSLGATTGRPITAMALSLDGGPYGSFQPFSTSATVNVPATEGTHTVAVKFRNGTGAVSQPATGSIYLVRTAPTITSISGDAGSPAGGNTVTVSGTHLAPGAAVTFGGTPSPTVKFVSGSTLRLTVPARSPGAAQVTVTTVAGSSAATVNSLYAYGAPTVSQVAPDAGSTSGGNTVTIQGNGFVPGTTVMFSTVNPGTKVSVQSGTRLTVVAPPRSRGTINVFVANPAGTSAKTNSDLYAYGPPAISSFTPASGNAGGVVTIDGVSFAPGATVKFGGRSSPSVRLMSLSELQATVPTGVSAGPISVTTPAGTGSSSATFTPSP